MTEKIFENTFSGIAHDKKNSALGQKKWVKWGHNLGRRENHTKRFSIGARLQWRHENGMQVMRKGFKDKCLPGLTGRGVLRALPDLGAFTTVPSPIFITPAGVQNHHYVQI